MDEAWTVTDFGTVHVHGRRTGDNGRVVEVQRSYQIVPEPVVNGIGALTPSDCGLPTAVRSSQALSGMPVNATWYAITERLFSTSERQHPRALDTTSFHVRVPAAHQFTESPTRRVVRPSG